MSRSPCCLRGDPAVGRAAGASASGSATRRRITETQPRLAHIRERKRLPTQHERKDVVPAGEVLRRHDGVTAWREDASEVSNKDVGIR